ncbi:MAG: Omp28-related outer membrane protein [Saprospiraceae bacterium]
MKNLFFCFFALSLLALSACKEEPIPIPDLSSGSHRLLVEELTGVQCAQCPDGSIELENLVETYGEENVIVVSIHAAQQFSVPFSTSQYDFRTDDGTAMADFIGAPLAFPTAAFNRRTVNGSAFLLPSLWASTAASQLQTDYKLGLYLTTEYDSSSRKLHMKINATPENTLDGDLRLSILITQDSIVDVQQVNLVKVNNYTHRHVLRDVVTKTDGDPIGALTGGEAFTFDYDVVLDPAWEARHCSVVAFIHHSGTPDKEVLQAVQAHVTE